MATAAGFVQVVIQIGAGRDEAVDVALAMRWATTIRSPPALSAPAMPKKIVQSAPSIFSQMRRAVARLRP